MTIDQVINKIAEIGIVPVVRAASVEEANTSVEAIRAGGIPIVEITMTVPEAVELIAHLVRDHEKMLVGAGSVLNTEVASKCVGSGAHFITSPGLNLKIVEILQRDAEKFSVRSEAPTDKARR